MKFLKWQLYSIHFVLPIMIMLLILFTSLSVTPSYESNNLTIISKDSNPYGIPFSVWTTKWWKWYIETPFDDNHPSKDRTGANCYRNQGGPVWFLSGSEIVPIEKTCIIPAGKSILFPILDYECSYVEDKSLKTPNDLTKCAKDGVDVMNLLDFRYNGTDVPEQKIKQEFRVTSNPFDVNFPVNNVFDAKPSGPSTAVSDGYWVMLAPPPPGSYDIKFKGCGGGATPTGPPAYTLTAGFCQDVSYHLKVVAP